MLQLRRAPCDAVAVALQAVLLDGGAVAEKQGGGCDDAADATAVDSGTGSKLGAGEGKGSRVDVGGKELVFCD